MSNIIELTPSVKQEIINKLSTAEKEGKEMRKVVLRLFMIIMNL
jgi:hypothetical protein